MSHRLSTFVAGAAWFVAGLGWISPAEAAKPDCGVEDSHPSCKPDDGGDGGGGGGGGEEYSGSFTAGAFDFDGGSIVLVPNSKGSRLQNRDAVTLTRPVEGDGSANADTMQWDYYFNTVCANLLGSAIVESLSVASGELTVEAAGPGDRRVIMREIALPSADGRGAEVTPQVIDHGPVVPLPGIFPADGESVQFEFESGVIFGRSNKGGPGGSQGCQASGGGSADEFPLQVLSVFTITNPVGP